MVQRWSEVNGWRFRGAGAITSFWPMEALWAGERQHCISATAKPGLQFACIPSHFPKIVRVGEAHLILVQQGDTLPTHGYSQRQESGSAPLSFKCEVKRKMSLFVLFRLAWRTALGSFPASWRTTILPSLYTSKCSVGICRSTVRALHKCLRGKGNSQPELGRHQCSCSTCAASEPFQEGFLPCGSAKPWNCQLFTHFLS